MKKVLREFITGFKIPFQIIFGTYPSSSNIPEEVRSVDHFFDRLRDTELSNNENPEWRDAILTLHYLKGIIKWRAPEQNDNIYKALEAVEKELRKCHGLEPFDRHKD